MIRKTHVLLTPGARPQLPLRRLWAFPFCADHRVAVPAGDERLLDGERARVEVCAELRGVVDVVEPRDGLAAGQRPVDRRVEALLSVESVVFRAPRAHQRDTIFIPNVPVAEAAAAQADAAAGGAQTATNQAVSTGPFSRSTQLTAADKERYSLVFFHTGLVQAVCSGLVAGQMGEGSVKAGVKHAAVMLTAAYGLFLLIG